MGMTEVVRGADLLGSTARQALLAELLGRSPPAFAHHPMIVSSDGTRLAKRASGVTLREHRALGASPESVIAMVAGALGLAGSRATLSARDFLASLDDVRLAGQREARLPA
jgi:glutamyl-tRNA synthetase